MSLLVEVDRGQLDHAIEYAQKRLKDSYKIRLTAEQLLQMILIVQQLLTKEVKALTKVDQSVVDLQAEMHKCMKIKLKRMVVKQENTSIGAYLKKTVWGIAGGFTAGWLLVQLGKLAMVVLPMLIKAAPALATL